MDPSGTFLQYDAKAIGSGSEGAQQSLQEVYHKVSILLNFRIEHNWRFTTKNKGISRFFF